MNHDFSKIELFAYAVGIQEMKRSMTMKASDIYDKVGYKFKFTESGGETICTYLGFWYDVEKDEYEHTFTNGDQLFRFSEAGLEKWINAGYLTLVKEKIMKIEDVKIGDRFRHVSSGKDVIFIDINSKQQGYKFHFDGYEDWISKKELQELFNTNSLEYIPPVLSVNDKSEVELGEEFRFTVDKDLYDDLLGCEHEYRHYQGIMQEYDYCVKCDHKKTD